MAVRPMAGQTPGENSHNKITFFSIVALRGCVARVVVSWPSADARSERGDRESGADRSRAATEERKDSIFAMASGDNTLPAEARGCHFTGLRIV